MENKAETKVTRKSDTKIRRADSKVRRPIFGYHRPIKPINSLKGHKLLALSLFFLFAVAGCVIAFFMRPVYSTEALIEINTDYETNLSNRNRNPLQKQYGIGHGYEEFAQSQVVFIKGYDVLYNALLQLGDDAEMWYEQAEEKHLAYKVLEEELIVKRVAGTFMLSVGLESPDPRGLKETINAVVDVYLKTVRGEGLGNEDARIMNLTKTKRDLENQLQRLVLRKTSLADELGVVITGDETLENPYATSMAQLRREFMDANIRHIEAQANLAALKDALENKYQSEDEILRHAIARVEANSVVQRQMYQLQDEKAGLWGKIEQLSPDYEITIQENNSDARRKATDEEEEYERNALEQQLTGEVKKIDNLERGYTALYSRAVQREREAIRRENDELISEATIKAIEAEQIKNNLEIEIDNL
ncbi:MAG: hypothetical protein JXA52_06680, partial [Planctomycetes bacterium]|nr:hypothetical protein [Planctomycetota bacterium]